MTLRLYLEITILVFVGTGMFAPVLSYNGESLKAKWSARIAVTAFAWPLWVPFGFLYAFSKLIKLAFGKGKENKK